jgi:hypothetical protein
MVCFTTLGCSPGWQVSKYLDSVPGHREALATEAIFICFRGAPGKNLPHFDNLNIYTIQTLKLGTVTE